MSNLSTEDQKWLDALAGHRVDELDPIHKAQADSVRTALTSRREAIDADAATIDTGSFEQLRERLIAEGLLSVTDRDGPMIGWEKALAWLGLGPAANSTGSALIVTRWMILAFALISVLMLTRLVVSSTNHGTPVDVLRGGSATVLIVPNPQLRSTDLQAGFRDAKAAFVVTVLQDGRIQIDVKSNSAALEYLESQRISPVVNDGTFRLLIQKEP